MTYRLGSMTARDLALILIIVLGTAIGLSSTFGGRGVMPHTAQNSQSDQQDSATPESSPCTAKQQTTRAGWRTCCDDFYNYCFDYPESWAASDLSQFNSYCAPNSVALTSPSGKVTIYYVNEDSHDIGLSSFYTAQIVNPSPADSSLSIIGGYATSDNVPEYRVSDTAAVSQYRPVVGRVTQFPNVMFSDQGTGAFPCVGSFSAYATTSFTTATQARTWFDTNDAKTALAILETLRYKP